MRKRRKEKEKRKKIDIPNLEHLPDKIQPDVGYETPLVGDDHHESVPFQMLQRFPDRCLADA
jgi:hypothetical protein